MRLTRGRGRAPLVLEINPVGGAGSQYRTQDVAALVLLVTPSVRARTDPDFAAAALGLALAEARVAVRLLPARQWLALRRSWAARRAPYESTQRVFRKQGITRQTQLVGIVRSLEALGGSHR